jgi:hypothetical protein
MAVARFWLVACLGLAVLVQVPVGALADGGTLRFSKPCGHYRITLFTAPAPLRAGPVDFSILVQATDSESPVLDIPVTVYVYPESDPQRRLSGPVTTMAATNKLFRAIQLDLSEPGRWHVEVELETPEGAARVDTDLEVGPALPAWIDLVLWISWPAVAIVLFGIHQVLVRRRKAAGRAA